MTELYHQDNTTAVIVLRAIAEVLQSINAEYFSDGDWREPPLDDVLRRIATRLQEKADELD